MSDRGIGTATEARIDRELDEVATALAECILFRRVQRVTEPRWIGFVDRAERLRELMEQDDGLLVPLVRGENFGALRIVQIGEHHGERRGLRLYGPATHDHVTPEELRATELVERLLCGIGGRDVPDHPDRIVVGFRFERGERFETFARIAAVVIPVLDRIDREPHAEHRREQLARIVELVGDLLSPLR